MVKKLKEDLDQRNILVEKIQVHFKLKENDKKKLLNQTYKIPKGSKYFIKFILHLTLKLHQKLLEQLEKIKLIFEILFTQNKKQNNQEINYLNSQKLSENVSRWSQQLQDWVKKNDKKRLFFSQDKYKDKHFLGDHYIYRRILDLKLYITNTSSILNDFIQYQQSLDNNLNHNSFYEFKLPSSSLTKQTPQKNSKHQSPPQNNQKHYNQQNNYQYNVNQQKMVQKNVGPKGSFLEQFQQKSQNQHGLQQADKEKNLTQNERGQENDYFQFNQQQAQQQSMVSCQQSNDINYFVSQENKKPSIQDQNRNLQLSNYDDQQQYLFQNQKQGNYNLLLYQEQKINCQKVQNKQQHFIENVLSNQSCQIRANLNNLIDEHDSINNQIDQDYHDNNQIGLDNLQVKQGEKYDLENNQIDQNYGNNNKIGLGCVQGKKIDICYPYVNQIGLGCVQGKKIDICYPYVNQIGEDYEYNYNNRIGQNHKFNQKNHIYQQQNNQYSQNYQNRRQRQYYLPENLKDQNYQISPSLNNQIGSDNYYDYQIDQDPQFNQNNSGNQDSQNTQIGKGYQFNKKIKIFQCNQNNKTDIDLYNNYIGPDNPQGFNSGQNYQYKNLFNQSYQIRANLSHQIGSSEYLLLNQIGQDWLKNRNYQNDQNCKNTQIDKGYLFGNPISQDHQNNRYLEDNHKKIPINQNYQIKVNQENQVDCLQDNLIDQDYQVKVNQNNQIDQNYLLDNQIDDQDYEYNYNSQVDRIVQSNYNNQACQVYESNKIDEDSPLDIICQDYQNNTINQDLQDIQIGQDHQLNQKDRQYCTQNDSNLDDSSSHFFWGIDKFPNNS